MELFEFPLIKRVYAKTIASELVSVKPMTAPSGIDFYTDFVIKPDTKAQDNFEEFYDEFS